MARQVKRYTICIKEGIETRRNMTYKELEDKIYEYNSNSKNPYFLSNLRLDNNKLLFDKYRKVTINSTLEDLDHTTTLINNDFELKELYQINPRNPHKLVILYRANKEIHEMPIIYKKDKKYLDVRFLEKEYISYSKCEDFITKILTNKKIEYSARNSIDDFDYLRVHRDNLRNDLPALISDYPISKFFVTFTYDFKNMKINYYRLRLLANLMIEYESELKKEDQEEDKEEQQEILGQLMIEEMAMKELRDHYEDLKYMLSEGSYTKELIPRK